MKRCCFKEPRYLPVESNLNEFTDIVVSSTMGADHMPDRDFLDLSNTKESLLHGHFEV